MTTLSVTRLRRKLADKPFDAQYALGRILAIYLGLMVIVFLASLDQTIVATAVPTITRSLGGLGSYSWIFSAYLLAQTITVPIYGKLSDVYGQRRVLLAATAIFLLGSALCGIATDINELVAFRAVQGTGAGGLIPVAMATIGRLVPPRARGRYQALISATFALSSTVGPAVGGLVVDHASWRWIFYINMPIGGLAVLLVTLTMPSLRGDKTLPIDYRGAALLAVGTASLLYALIQTRDTLRLTGGMLVPLASSVLTLGAFGIAERRARDPILPFSALRERVVAASVACVGLSAICMFGAVVFIPLFAQAVLGRSATSSGVVLTPMMLAAATATVLSGQWVSRTGKYRRNALVGPVVLGTGLVLASQMSTSTTTGEAIGNVVLIGAGVGLMMQVFIVAAQNAVPFAVIGATTAMLQFSRAISITFGVTVFGLIVNHGLPSYLRGRADLPRQLPEAGRAQVAAALEPAFLFGAALCVAIFVLALFGVDQRPLRTTLALPDEQHSSTVTTVAALEA